MGKGYMGGGERRGRSMEREIEGWREKKRGREEGRERWKERLPGILCSRLVHPPMVLLEGGRALESQLVRRVVPL